MNPAKFQELKLFCVLTDEEVQSRALMLADTISTIDAIQSARTEAAEQFKERITGLEEEQRKLAWIVRERTEERLVSCRVLFHVPGEGMKRVVRTDTGEVVREEKMSDGEAQMHLFAAQADFAQFMEGQMAVEPSKDADDSPAKAASEDE